MRQKINRFSFGTILCAASTAVLIAMMSVLLTGCTLFPQRQYATFTEDSIQIYVGQIYDLSKIINSNTDDYEISIESLDVLSRSGKKIMGKAAGRSKVSVITSNSEDTLNVTVVNPEPSAISIEASGQSVQTVGQTSTVLFVAEVTGEIRGSDIDWYVNNEFVQTLGASIQFSFTPSDAGLYTITAEIGSYSAQSVVRVYYDVDATGSASGELNQLDGNITAITLSATVSSDLRNPANQIMWVVDGKTVYEGENTYYRYVPSTGTHVIELYVNGVKRLIDGKSSITVRAAGKADVPTVTGVTFDNVHPHVYIDYEGADIAEVEITMPDGVVWKYSQTDSVFADRFSDGRFDAQSIIAVCATSSTRKSYGIKVRALGDGDLISDSDYSDTYTFEQIPSAAKTYLEEAVLDFDHYVSSEEEYIDLLEYYILGRSKTASRPSVSFSCYIAFGMTRQSEAEDLFENAFEWAATSGSYTGINIKFSANVMTTSFTVSTVNRPTRQTYTGRNASEYAEELHAIAPHVNYDETKYRADDYVFPIDTAERTESVSYTDELYYAVEHNTRPIPAAGSAADTVYQKAREALRMIVTDDMTDVEKAHAIYDWIMWKVSYDTPATEVAYNGEAYSAYYLEGVFGDGSTAVKDMSTGTSVVYYPYAVCDGLSKAYTLMCNIEGIPCVRVAGTAGESLRTAGGHAWNKVYVNGGWYLVDITWGDAQARIGRTVYELSLHDWLFLTDEQADPTHFEPYEAGDSYLINVPETSTTKFDIYKQMSYNGVDINCSIGKSESQSERLEEIATLFAQSYEPRSSLYVPGCGTSATQYVGFDVKFVDGMTISESNALSIVRSAVRKYVPSATVDVYLTSDDILIVLIS